VNERRGDDQRADRLLQRHRARAQLPAAHYYSSSIARGPAAETGVMERCGNRDKTARYREKQRV
jgi:hypothetical protein